MGIVTGARFFAYFSTNDLFSGISYYEVSTVDMSDPQAAANPFFTEATSPYRIPFEAAGKYAILVRAYDNAGNFIESKSVLSIVSPFISYTEKGIRKLEKRIREMRGLEEEAKKQRERLIGRLE